MNVNADKPHNRPWRSLLLPAATVLLLLVAAFNAVQIVNSSKDELQQLTQERAKIAAQAVDQQINSLRDLLLSRAKSADVVNLLDGKNPSSVSIIEDTVLAKNPDVLRVFLIPKEAAQTLDLRFAEMDMARRAARGETVLPEAYKTAAQTLFVLTVPVHNKAEDTVLGSLLVRFTVRPLVGALHTAGAEAGRIVLQQQFGNTHAMSIVSLEAENTGDHAPERVASSTPHWQIVLMPSIAMAKQASNMTIALIPLLLAIMPIIMMLWLVLARVYRRWKSRPKKKTVRSNAARASRARQNAATSQAGRQPVKKTPDNMVDLMFQHGHVMRDKNAATQTSKPAEKTVETNETAVQ